MNYRQIFAIQREKEKLILKLCPNMPRKSGIYMFHRVNEKGEKCVYIGQAQDLLYRTGQHLAVSAKKTHIDKSLHKHKLYNSKNPFGWKVCVIILCPTEQLDVLEQKYIDHYKNKSDVKIYNVAGGGQINKAGDIGERFEVKLKNYKTGKNKGYEKAREQIKVYFEKYLDYSIKGRPTKTKERKMQEFADFLADITKVEENRE